MAEHPMMPFWTDAYLGDTRHLSTIEHGAYLLLLITMWRNKGSLPNDDKLLARYAQLTSAQWNRMKPMLMPFFNVIDDQITQSRLTDEYDAVRQLSKKQSRKARSRWLKEKETGNAVASERHASGNASPSPSPSPIPYSVAKATDASVPCKQVDPKKVVYDSGKSLLQAYGIANGTAGGMITKWLKQHDPTEVMQAIMTAGERERHNVIEFISGVLKNGEQTGETHAERVARLVAKFDARGPGEV